MLIYIIHTKKFFALQKFLDNTKINLFKLKFLELNIYLRMEDNLFCTIFGVPPKIFFP